MQGIGVQITYSQTKVVGTVLPDPHLKQSDYWQSNSSASHTVMQSMYLLHDVKEQFLGWWGIL